MADCSQADRKGQPYYTRWPQVWHGVSICDNTMTLISISFCLEREHTLEGDSGPLGSFAIDGDLVDHLVLDEAF